MSTKFDAATYQHEQRESWDASAAGWRKWWRVVERGAMVTNERLVEVARIGPGARVVDVGTGVGEPAITAARAVGPAGKVIGTDLSEELLQIARERAEAEGLRNAEFVVVDAESLDLPASQLDAILARWSLMYFVDLDAALASMAKHLKPGGRIAAAVWDRAYKVVGLSLAGELLRQLVNPEPQPPGTPGPFDLWDAAAWPPRLEAAGFTDVVVERQTVMFKFASVEEYLEFLYAVTPRFKEVLDQETGQRRALALQALANAAARVTLPDGSLALPSETLIVAAARR